MKIWLYYANAGGGHRAPALRMESLIRARYGAQATVRLVDVTKKGNRLVAFFFEKGYAWLVQRAPLFYKLLYYVSSFRVVMWLENMVAAISSTSWLAKEFEKDAPDVIIATYFLLEPLRIILRKKKSVTPLFVVVTDPFTPPPIWFYASDLRYIVFSEAAKQIGVEAGIATDNITVFPCIVNATKQPADLALLPDGLVHQKIVLVIGGLDGLPNGKAVVQALVQQTVRPHIVVVCGTNARWQKEMQQVALQYPGKITVFGFLPTVGSLLARADMVLIKAGANIMSEALYYQKPIVIVHYIWGQELGNKDFVVASGVGWYEPRAKKIPALVHRYFENDAVAERIKAAYDRLHWHDGAEAVVTHCLEKKNRRLWQDAL